MTSNTLLDLVRGTYSSNRAALRLPRGGSYFSMAEYVAASYLISARIGEQHGGCDAFAPLTDVHDQRDISWLATLAASLYRHSHSTDAWLYALGGRISAAADVERRDETCSCSTASRRLAALGVLKTMAYFKHVCLFSRNGELGVTLSSSRRQHQRISTMCENGGVARSGASALYPPGSRFSCGVWCVFIIESDVSRWRWT